MPRVLEGRQTVVASASRGIGAAVAQRFGAEAEVSCVPSGGQMSTGPQRP